MVVSDPAAESGDEADGSGDGGGEGGEFILFGLAYVEVLDAIERDLELL